MSVKTTWNMECPNCGRDDALDVEMRVMGRLTSEGTDCDLSADGDHIWHSASRCICAHCGWDGTAGAAERPDDSEADPVCRTCGDAYAEGGDGYDGECPSCADQTDQKLNPENYK